MRHHMIFSAAFAAALLLAQGVAPAAPASDGAPAAGSHAKTRATSLPAKGLFVGDQLSEATKAKLTDLILEALGLQVEVALIVPRGPWQIDGATHTDRDLNEARLDAVRRFLAQRGVDPKHIFVESRVDEKLTEPRLDIQLVGTPAD